MPAPDNRSRKAGHVDQERYFCHTFFSSDIFKLFLSSEREIETTNSRLLENVIDFLKYEHVDFSGKCYEYFMIFLTFSKDLTLEQSSRFDDNELDPDVLEFESEEFRAVGHTWKVVIEIKDAKSNDPDMSFYIRLCNPSSRNTFYNKVSFTFTRTLFHLNIQVAFHMTNSSNTVWRITPKAWIHEFTQSASSSPRYPLPISKRRLFEPNRE